MKRARQVRDFLKSPCFAEDWRGVYSRQSRRQRGFPICCGPQSVGALVSGGMTSEFAGPCVASAHRCAAERSSLFDSLGRPNSKFALPDDPYERCPGKPGLSAVLKPATPHSTGVAARLEALAAPGSIVIGESVRQLLEGYFALKPLGPAPSRGSASHW
jgi:hypothetical protein